MKFKEIRMEEDWEYRLNQNDDPHPLSLIGVTFGCGCCSKNVLITKENLREHIASLREELLFARNLLASKYMDYTEE